MCWRTALSWKESRRTKDPIPMFEGSLIAGSGLDGRVR